MVEKGKEMKACPVVFTEEGMIVQSTDYPSRVAEEIFIPIPTTTEVGEWRTPTMQEALEI